MTRTGVTRVLASREAVAILAVTACLLLISLAVTTLGGKALQATAANGFVLLILVIGLGVFVGTTGILSFGHASFAAIAAYVTAILTVPPALKGTLLPDLPGWLSDLSLPTSLAIPAAIAASTLIGILAGIAIVRLNGAAAAIATLGLLIISNSALIGAADYTRGAQALYGIPASIGVWSAALLTAVAFAVARVFKESTYGIKARASRDDEAAARSIGIAAHDARFAPWVLSVAVVALGGALLAHRLTVISPKEFYFEQSFEWLVVLIVGGLLSVSGNIVGAIFVVLLIELLRRVEEGVTLFGMTTPQLFGLTDAGLSLAILAVLIRRGSGLAGATEIDHWPVFQRWPTALSHADEPVQVAAPAGRVPQPEERLTLAVDTLGKRYGGVQALSSVTISIKEGAIVGLIGPNGSGKSTLLGCISRAIEPTSGTISVGSTQIASLEPHEIVRQGIARTFQNIRLFRNLTVAENIEAALIGSGQTSRRQDSVRLARVALKRSGLRHLSDRLATSLSYGEQRRLEIARALSCKPRFLLLDEPAAGMNEQESAALGDLLRSIRGETGIGILIVEHDLGLILSLCDEIVVLEKGQMIASGTPEQIRRDPKVAAAYLGRQPAEADRPQSRQSSHPT